MKTLEQMRAEYAWKKIKELKDNQEYNKKNKELYASYVCRLPADIISIGLGQSLATLLAASQKNEDPHYILYTHLQGWLCSKDNDIAPYPNAGDLLEAIINNDQEHYKLARAEALALLEWLKKFAEAYLKKTKYSSEEGVQENA